MYHVLSMYCVRLGAKFKVEIELNVRKLSRILLP